MKVLRRPEPVVFGLPYGALGLLMIITNPMKDPLWFWAFNFVGACAVAVGALLVYDSLRRKRT